MSIDDVKRKVRSLLTVAMAGSGATEPERATARQLAAQLMVKYGLNAWDIPERQVERLPPAPPRPKWTVVVNVNGNNVRFNVGDFVWQDSSSGTTGNW